MLTYVKKWLMSNVIRALLCIATYAAVLAPASVFAQDEVVYFHTDAIGSVRMVTDSAGQEVARYDYLLFGEPWPSSGAQETRRFGGKERDPETAFDYFGARHYSSQVGRFTTVDPVLNVDTALTDPQRWNRYVYARNNPLVFTDPDGKDLYRPITPLQRDLMRIAGAIRDRIAGALGANSTASEHSLGAVGRNVLDSLLATVLPRDEHEYVDAVNASIMGLAAPLESGAASAITRLKPINLPAWRTVAVDMEEVISGHTSSGARAVQSGIKSLFPGAMSESQIENAVRNAYRYGKKVATQGNRVKIRGPWDEGTIELWLNTSTKTIETAYPIP